MKEKLQELIEKEGKKDQKKKIENIVVFILILIVTIIAINTIWGGNKEEKEESKANSQTYGKEFATTGETKQSATESTQLEQNLESILGNMDGVGDVKVLITYSQSSEIVGMYNENSKNTSTEEKDSGGGTRTIQETDTQKEVIYKEENGEKVPITQKVINPKIEGAIITAEGANNAVIKNNIIQAVEAVTGIATHKIQVFEKKK